MCKKWDNRNCTRSGITLLRFVSKPCEFILGGMLNILTETFKFREWERTITYSPWSSLFRKWAQRQRSIAGIFRFGEGFWGWTKNYLGILETTNFCSKLLKSIKKLCKERSNAFNIIGGLGQWCVLNPTLYIIYKIYKSRQNEITNIHIGYNKLMLVYLSECEFSDDLMICAPTRNRYKEIYCYVEKFYGKWIQK